MTSLDELNEIRIKNDLEAFNVIKNHLLSMEEKSMSDCYDCMYRGGEWINEYDDEAYFKYNGSACAVGALIRNDCYDSVIESRTIDDDEYNIVIDFVKKSHPDWKITRYSIAMMRAFQIVHDGCNLEDWPEEIKTVESVFGFDENGNISGIINKDVNDLVLLTSIENILKVVK